MIFFLNADGNTTIVKNQAINQGSIDANSLIIVAPFSRTNVVSASFILPNGLVVEGGIAVPLADLGTTPLKDNNGNIYNAWGLDLDFPVTQYSGTVKVQFSISLGSGKTLKTYTTQFEVSKGIVAPIPDFNEIENGEEIYTKIKDYLASISENMMSAPENGISYIRYNAPENLLNGADSGCSLYVVNGNNTIEVNAETREQIGEITNGDVTVASMTEYLTDEQLKNPNLNDDNVNDNTPGNKDLNFFQYNVGSGTPYRPAGFIVKLPEISNIGIVQLYIYSVFYDCDLQISTSINGQNYIVKETIPLKKLVYLDETIVNEMQIIRVPINVANAQYIKVVQTTGITNGNYVCKGIEIFSQAVNGYYTIVQNNGNTFDIDSYNANTLISIVESLKADAQASEESAQKWAEGTPDENAPQHNHSAKDYAKSITDLAGQAGGYPVLAMIDGSPKIPSVYINQVEIHNRFEITSESQLATVDAQPGDIAYLVGNVDGVPTVKKSWLLMSIENGTRNWVIYGTSYADNAGNANYAASAGNAYKINDVTYKKVPQSVYNNLTDIQKEGVYFVVLGE